ncbi:MAG TPA: hypothetical protein VE057_25815 [Archangium sp.]|nr:hypothetical protein [Archangium sp.]
MELILVSLVGMVVFGGLFLLLCPEWWSTSLGTLKDKPPAKKTKGAEDSQGPKTDT